MNTQQANRKKKNACLVVNPYVKPVYPNVNPVYPRVRAFLNLYLTLTECSVYANEGKKIIKSKSAAVIPIMKCLVS